MSHDIFGNEYLEISRSGKGMLEHLIGLSAFILFWVMAGDKFHRIKTAYKYITYPQARLQISVDDDEVLTIKELVYRLTLTLLGTVAFSLIVTYVAQYLTIGYYQFSLSLFLAIWMGVISFILAKSMILNYVFWVFEEHTLKAIVINRVKIYSQFILLLVIGYVSIFLFFGIEYGIWVAYLILGSLIFLVFAFFLELYKIIVANKLSPFYFILYLCTLEVVPIFWIGYLIKHW